MLWMPDMIQELASREPLDEHKLADAFRHAFREHRGLSEGEQVADSPYSIQRLLQGVPKERRKSVLRIALEAKRVVDAGG